MANAGCVIFAKNVDLVSRFYQAALELEVVEEKSSHHVLSNTDIELVIHGIPKKVAESINIERPPRLRETAVFKPAFFVESLTRVRQACDATQGGLNPEDKAWNIRGAIVLDGWDPEGNIVQFKERT